MKRRQSDDRSQMNVLDAEECFVLLRWEIIGRLGVSIPDRGTVDRARELLGGPDGTIVFRLPRCEKYQHLDSNLVSLEVRPVRLVPAHRVERARARSHDAEECTEADAWQSRVVAMGAGQAPRHTHRAHHGHRAPRGLTRRSPMRVARS